MKLYDDEGAVKVRKVKTLIKHAMTVNWLTVKLGMAGCCVI